LNQETPQPASGSFNEFSSEFTLPSSEEFKHRNPITQSWRYAILQCVDKKNDEVYLRIIALNDLVEAMTAMDSLKSGRSFSEIALEHSLHPTRNEGGNLGWFQVSELDQRFRSAIKNISLGAHTGIIDMTAE
jgi:hypothetical protein